MPPLQCLFTVSISDRSTGTGLPGACSLAPQLVEVELPFRTPARKHSHSCSL